MCVKCKINFGPICEAELTDKTGTESYCFNCIAEMCYHDSFKFTPDVDLVCEVTRRPGAVRFHSELEDYVLAPDIMVRLLRHGLAPMEYFELIKNHSSDSYMIHDDFYTEDGIAIQPVPSEKGE